MWLVVSVCLTTTTDCISHPLQIREKNMYKTVDKTIYKQAFSPETLIRCWNECLEKSCFHSRRMQVEEFNKKNYWKKKGIAIIPMKFSVGFAATSYHQVSPDHSWPNQLQLFRKEQEPTTAAVLSELRDLRDKVSGNRLLLV